MKKNSSIARSTLTGRFTTKSLGKGKAERFARVEGLSLTQRSASTISHHEQRGLKGDALRSAITREFVIKRG